jgi:hypothetical protein
LTRFYSVHRAFCRSEHKRELSGQQKRIGSKNLRPFGPAAPEEE